ncbi:hypothetical protein LEP1GSC202_3843 [Leptospira yanagawae serovar Saopaulo str. Sao Paulo = ATCC 700523]|uniref:Uncharacterized protein n=1 Tax=Leptospira yanagawae serovar Saopaulo str. Sao Paulo = ATCC 700523 TaxID=1249483 RepID=A0A5E8HHR7_9LEPT|nr:hypothetical protein LEP1GSC202_3843 [Leptospira yanagawae serovar Saopaulo str. Sao Paulo = ATCC 700523]
MELDHFSFQSLPTNDPQLSFGLEESIEPIFKNYDRPFSFDSKPLPYPFNSLHYQRRPVSPLFN